MEERLSITAWRKPTINTQADQHWDPITYITGAEKKHLSDFIAVIN